MFDVTEEYSVGDLTDVKEERQLVPVTKKVKVRVSKAGIQENKDKDLKGLKLEVRIVDGIETTDKESGETKMAFVNKPLFTGIMDLCFYADLETRFSDWFKKKQHLVGFKQFCEAIGADLKAVVINDEFFSNLIGKEVLVDIQHEEETALDESGNRQKLGTFRERLRNWKKVV